ncbi:hypothetical protein GPJ56_005539 [Histomonas meleagridis]|uniref:uncharacterized protein n=1 Tax=Histomonas meleagridis TaxID=135588 RepID=UPI0035597090|nr:hypothetical protein GPJ56_005539 [Histomonas meleagridis]KAH0799591.1 hypothetical protein GO595_007659 [Histomonas meleagridis]
MISTKKNTANSEETPDDDSNKENPGDTDSIIPTFTKADTSLPLAQQAKENFKNFKKYLDSNPPDPASDYDHVYQTMSHAFSDWTNQVTTLEANISDLSAQIGICEEKIKEKENQKSQLEKQLSELSNEKNLKLRELKEQKLITSRIEVRNQISPLKLQINDLINEFNNISGKLQVNKELLSKELEKTDHLQKHFDDLEMKIKEQEDNVRTEIERSEAEIKKLKDQAKKVEIIVPEQIEPKQTKRRRSSNYQEAETFVIKDNVKVSQEEINTLKYMISEIQKENDKIKKERDSKMVDIDCLLQENIGLKQMIRDITE